MALTSRVDDEMSDMSPAQNERLRRAMSAMLAKSFKGNVSALARALKRSQPSIRAILAGEGGAAFATVQAFALLEKRDPLEIIGPADEQPGEDLRVRTSTPALPSVATEIRVRELFDWYFGTKNLVEAVAKHQDVTFGDLLRYRAEPARHNEADPDEVYRHIQQLRAGGIGATVPSEAISSSLLSAEIDREHEAAIGPEKPSGRRKKR